MSERKRQLLLFVGLAFLAATAVLLTVAAGREIQRAAALVEPSGGLLQPPTATPDFNGESGITPTPVLTQTQEGDGLDTPTPSIVLIPTLIIINPIATIPPAMVTRFPTLPVVSAGTRTPGNLTREPGPTVPVDVTRVVPLVTPTPPSPTKMPSPNAERIEIVSEFPLEVETGQSEWVRLTLRRSPEGEIVVTIEATPRPTTVVTPDVEIIGTPEVPLANAFGPDYRGCVDATLIGSAFDIASTDFACVSLSQNPIVWTWNISPKDDSFRGEQTLNATLRVVWTHRETGREIDSQQIPLPPVPVTVRAPITGRIQWSAVLTSAIGSIFSVPWLHGRWQAFRKRRKKGVDGPILAPLRRQMVKHLNEADLRVLAFDYGILFENLVGDSYSAKTADFLEKAIAKGVLDDIIAQLQEEYPGVDWARPER